MVGTIYLEKVTMTRVEKIRLIVNTIVDNFVDMLGFHASTSPNFNVDKVGNLIIYLVDNIKRKYKQDLYLTKLLKLLYIIDETAVEETAATVTGLEYRVWKMGPVAFEVYKDFNYNNSEEFSCFAESIGTGDSSIIKSVNKFDDSEFSDYEIDLIDRVIDKYGNLNGSHLIELLHEEGSLWEKIVTEKKIRFSSEKNTSQYKIDLSEKLTEEYKKQLFRNSF